MATLQHKPVLFVSPPIVFPTLHQLREHLGSDSAGAALLKQLEKEIPIKENPRGIPSLWYIPLVGGENFFDGFGFAAYRKRFGWQTNIAIDAHEKRFPPERPLLPWTPGRLGAGARFHRTPSDQRREENGERQARLATLRKPGTPVKTVPSRVGGSCGRYPEICPELGNSDPL